MLYYEIGTTLSPAEPDPRGGGAQYVALVTSEEWLQRREVFDMVIDIDPELTDRRETKAIVNYDSLTGCFSVPDRKNLAGDNHTFAFALDEKGVVLIDDEGYAARLVETIRLKKKWRLPSLERFLYDLLETIIEPDLYLLERLENQLNDAEREILGGEIEDFPPELNDVRGELLDLRAHYEQLIDFGQELQENENGFFKAENLRYFKLFTERVERLQVGVTHLREYVVQLRDLMQSQLSVKQNKIMTLLTVVTAIFMPLTLITGWYGMNFRYMPELDEPLAYPAVLVVFLIIIAACLLWFKKKKWL
ncbi:MAG: magnesium transporter CorA [Oscillibacter sp.]|nr:magnesium transporter CorA [Oscillibacter sp.]